MRLVHPWLSCSIGSYLDQLEIVHWVGLRENLQETPIFNGENHGFL
jgi:hypothetical protein